MKLLFGHSDTVAELVARLSPLEKPTWPGGCTAIGIIRDDGALVGGAVLSEHRKEFSTLELSGCALSSYAFGPRIVRQLGELIFGQLEVHRLWAKTSLRNEHAKRFLRHVGFTQEAVLSHFYGPKHHACQWRLLRSEWEASKGAALQKAA